MNQLESRIRELLLKDGFTEDQAAYAVSRIQRTREKNSFYDTSELIDWLESQRATNRAQVEEVPIRSLENWEVDGHSFNIRHRSGQFFGITGVRVRGASREVSGWEQPLISQKEMGILGVIRSTIEGTEHYLLNAKFEPGNLGSVLVAPTLQATFSNLNRAHGGVTPRYAEYFLGDHPEARVIYRKWLAEDGGRFFRKSNLNMLVEVPHRRLGAIPDDFRWFTLSQFREFLMRDNLVNPDVRSVLCHLL